MAIIMTNRHVAPQVQNGLINSDSYLNSHLRFIQRSNNGLGINPTEMLYIYLYVALIGLF